MTDTADTSAPAAAPAAAASFPAPVPAAAPPAPAWHDAMDPTVKSWATTSKGYDLTEAPKVASLALQGHMNAEKMIGADRAGRTVVIPDETDKEGWAKVYTKLGRPEAPAQYELPVPEGDKGEFAKQASDWMFEAGVPKKAAQHLAQKWNEHVAQVMQAQTQAEEAKLAEEHRQLANDWGQAAPIQTELARRGAKNLGLDDGAIDALQKTSGYAKTMKALARMGEMTGERPAHGLDTQGGFSSTTPEQASAMLKSKSQDKEWGSKAMKPGTQENEEFKRLTNIVATQAANQR